MRTSPALRTAVAIAAVALTAAAAASPALAADTYTLPLHQAVPITASGFDSHGSCPGIPSDEDGWHFVLPADSTHFVKLTVTFQPGGSQVVTSFGPPSDKHAYVASAAGAKLVSAVAEVTGGSDRFFNLSHTCPATSNGGGTPPSSPPATAPPSSPPATIQPSESHKPTNSPSPSPTRAPSSSASPSASHSPGTSPAAQPSSAAAGGGSGELASTGAGVIDTTLAGVALIGVGGALVMHRRRAARRH